MIKRAIIRVIVDNVEDDKVLAALAKIKDALSEYLEVSVTLERVR